MNATTLKQVVSLLDIFQSDGHALKRDGARMKCLCPFHDEKTPSCVVDAERFHCFGCGADGDVFDYVARRDGCDFKAAMRLLEMKAGVAAGQPIACTPRPRPNNRPQPWQPYRMSEAELLRCVAMAETLLRDERAIKGIAEARNWQPETIRGLALDPCLGVDAGKLILIYPTGAKKRIKPLTPSAGETFEGTKFKWMFGKPDALWRSDRLLRCTETVHICEGETAAVSLIDAGIDNQITEIVLGVPGASCWRDEWAEMFRERRVVLWPDADDAGNKLKQRIIASTSHCAKSIEVVPAKEAASL